MFLTLLPTLIVSIHAPLTGGDKNLACSLNATVFQSTPPSREATVTVVASTGLMCFNPRPLTGGDRSVFDVTTDTDCFNPCPPHGRRQKPRVLAKRDGVSIHAPLTGGDAG